MSVSRRSFVASLGAGTAGLLTAPLIRWHGHEALLAQGQPERRADRLLASAPGMIRIDSNGRVLAPQRSREGELYRWEIPDGAETLPVTNWHEYKKVAGVLLATIPIDSRSSPYAVWGDWFAAGCGGVLLLTLIVLSLARVLGGVA